MKIHEGYIGGNKVKVAIVISRFNEFITGKLLDGARDCLIRHGIDDDSISVYWVPGAFEIPFITKKITDKGGYDGIICLGAIIRGDTPHFDYVAAECSKGVANVAMGSDMPIVFGVLTTDTVDQAIDRAGTKAGNKGFDAAMSMLELIDLMNKI